VKLSAKWGRAANFVEKLQTHLRRRRREIKKQGRRKEDKGN
jgi:hypothetical protein